MPRILFTSHALRRMRERVILRSLVTKTVFSPDKIERSVQRAGRFLAKKIYYNSRHKEDRLLLVIFEKHEKTILVVTVIDTSKISRYI